MQQEDVKKIFSDPAKLEAELKKGFAAMDKDNKGYVSFEVVHHALAAQAEKLGHKIDCSSHKAEDMEKAKKLADPSGEDKVTFEGFKALVLASIKHHEEHH